MELPTFCYSHFEQQNIDPWRIKKLKNMHVQEAVTHFILFKLGYYFLDIQYIATKPKLLGFDTF